MSEVTITLEYDCPACGIQGRKVSVRERRQGENIVEWLELVAIVGCGDDHRAASPQCKPRQLHNLKIPVPHGEAAPLGTAQRQ